MYDAAMGRTNIEIDDALVAQVMHVYNLPTKRAAVDYALRALVGDGDKRSLLELEGIGWNGSLDEMRGSRIEEL